MRWNRPPARNGEGIALPASLRAVRAHRRLNPVLGAFNGPPSSIFQVARWMSARRDGCSIPGGTGNPQDIPLPNASFGPWIRIEQAVEVNPVCLGDGIRCLLALHRMRDHGLRHELPCHEQSAQNKHTVLCHPPHSHSMVAGGLEEMS